MLEYYMFNKPSGCITARRDPRHKTVMDYFPEEKRDELFPLGRLDKDTEGLLIVSNDGDLWQSLMMPERHVSKTYFFWAQGSLTQEDLNILESGVCIYEKSKALTAPSKIRVVGEGKLSEIKEFLSARDKKLFRGRENLPAVCAEITITEGKKHQVKRMLGYVGCKIVYLRRVAIGNLKLDEKLKEGSYRALTEDELLMLKK